MRAHYQIAILDSHIAIHDLKNCVTDYPEIIEGRTENRKAHQRMLLLSLTHSRILDTLAALDQKAFFFINQSLRNSFFDFIMPYARDKDCWIPVYVLIAAYVIYRFRWNSIIVIISAGITVLLTDQIASSIIKPALHRIRPCNDPVILPHIHLLVECGSGFSFVSSHASNHFGLAVFLILLLGKRFSWITPVALLWATLICFAQVYVGLHYPADVIVGGLLGGSIGIITGKLCKASLRKFGVEIA